MFSGSVLVTVSEADQSGGVVTAAGDIGQGSDIILDEPGFEQEVMRWIAGKG